MFPPEEPLKSSGLEKTIKFLKDQGCFHGNFNGVRIRAVKIEKDKLYESLVSLYTKVIQLYWSKFRIAAEYLKPPPPTETSSSEPDYAQYIARVYISHWFLDLYVSNKDACRQQPLFNFHDYYKNKITPSSHEYDVFLQHLNSVIRPTTIHGPVGKLLCFPYFADATPDNKENPLNIRDAVCNRTHFFSILYMMKNGLKFKELADNKIARGGAAWLFDWVDKNTMYSWFSKEPNYTDEDCIYAYVIGGPCSPKLAICDADDKQIYENNVKPTSPKASDYKRLIPRRMDANFVFTEFNPNASFDVSFPISRHKKLKFSEEREEDDEVDKTVAVKYNCYQFIDYLYPACIFYKTDGGMRFELLLQILTDRTPYYL